MKYLYTLTLLVVMMSFIACNTVKDPHKVLTSTKWRIDAKATIDKMIDEMSVEEKKAFERDGVFEIKRKALEKVRVVFKKDGVLKSDYFLVQKKDETGDWKVNKKKKTLTITPRKVKGVLNFIIERMSSSRVVLRIKKEDRGDLTHIVLQAVD